MATWAFVILMALNALAVALELFNLVIMFTDFLWEQRRGGELTRGCEALRKGQRYRAHKENCDDCQVHINGMGFWEDVLYPTLLPSSNWTPSFPNCVLRSSYCS